MSSSRSSRYLSKKPDIIFPANSPILREEGFDKYEFNKIATWETPLKNKGLLETGIQIKISVELSILGRVMGEMENSIFFFF